MLIQRHQWREVLSDGVRVVKVQCPGCGVWGELDHAVASDGAVTPSLQCPECESLRAALAKIDAALASERPAKLYAAPPPLTADAQPVALLREARHHVAASGHAGMFDRDLLARIDNLLAASPPQGDALDAKNAARYRWLRDYGHAIYNDVFNDVLKFDTVEAGAAKLDAAIDSAIAAMKEQA